MRNIPRSKAAVVGQLVLAALLTVPAAVWGDNKVDGTIAFLEAYAPTIDHPAVGAVIFKERTGIQTVCTGTLVAAEWFLTAEHCFVTADLTDKVYLPAEGILDIEAVTYFCETQEDSCDEDVNDLLLVKLATAAEVWPPTRLRSSNVMLEIERKRIGYGATESETSVGVGLKHVITFSETVQVNHCPEPPESRTICSTSPVCSGDSGGPLVILGSPNPRSWGQAAVTREGYCGEPNTLYVNVAFDDFEGWVDRTANPASLQTIRPFESWGRAEQGVARQQGQCPSDPGDDLTKTFIVPGSSEPWAAPAWDDVPNIVVDVPAGGSVQLLRATLNYEEDSWSCCEDCGRNEFRLAITPPDGGRDEACECSEPGWSFVHCDCEQPTPGPWIFDVVADQGAGTYQLLILPLGEPTSAVSPLVQPGGERVVLGDELRSAPIVLVNVEEDGTPSRRLIDFIRKYQIDPETRRLGALRNEASSAEP